MMNVFIRSTTASLFLTIVLALVLCSDTAFAAKRGKPARQQKIYLGEIKHQLSNIEAEVSVLRESVHIQQENLDILRQEQSALTNTVRRQENRSQALTDDLRNLSNHASNSTSSFEQYRQKTIELEGIIAIQNRNINKLQQALQSLMGVVQKDHGIVAMADGTKKYQVQSGDNLGKIAQKHKISVPAIKKANKLKNDRIFPGQQLIIP